MARFEALASLAHVLLEERRSRDVPPTVAANKHVHFVGTLLGFQNFIVHNVLDTLSIVRKRETRAKIIAVPATSERLSAGINMNAGTRGRRGVQGETRNSETTGSTCDRAAPRRVTRSFRERAAPKHAAPAPPAYPFPLTSIVHTLVSGSASASPSRMKCMAG